MNGLYLFLICILYDVSNLRIRLVCTEQHCNLSHIYKRGPLTVFSNVEMNQKTLNYHVSAYPWKRASPVPSSARSDPSTYTCATRSSCPLPSMLLPLHITAPQMLLPPKCSCYPFAREFQESGRWRDLNLFR
jgi:hypothetical protein